MRTAEPILMHLLLNDVRTFPHYARIMLHYYQRPTERMAHYMLHLTIIGLLPFMNIWNVSPLDLQRHSSDPTVELRLVPWNTATPDCEERCQPQCIPPLIL